MTLTMKHADGAWRREMAQHMFVLYGIRRLTDSASTDALAYGATNCRLARFIHNRIVPLCHDPR